MFLLRIQALRINPGSIACNFRGQGASFEMSQRVQAHYLRGEMVKSGGKLTVLNAAIAKRFDVDPGTVTRWRQRWIEDECRCVRRCSL